MRPVFLALGLVTLLGATAAPASAQQHAHPTSAAAASATPAQRYVTDATLRQQMREIHGAVATLERGQGDQASPQQTTRLADQVTGNVNTIIVNCKLPPDADAALHLIIGPLLRDASALKANPARRGAVAGMREALQQYARQFDDPGFPDAPR